MEKLHNQELQFLLEGLGAMVHAKWHQSNFSLFRRCTEFFATQFEAGKGYQSLNCYRSALSSVLALIEGFAVGSHLLVCRILKGVFHLRPPQAKYTSFWSVSKVLNHLASWGENQALTLKQLIWKLAM